MKISGSRIDLENGRIDNAVLKGYGETLVGGVSGATSGTAYTVDISSGNIFHIFMNGNCTFTFSNPTASGTTCYFTLLLKQDGATRTATWPSTVTWAGGSAPTLSTSGGAHDIVSFLTTDGGSSYIGFIGGQSFPIEPAPTLYNLFAFGQNNQGQIGDGTVVNRSTPIQVGTLSTWSAIGAGSNNTFATRSDNTAWSCGYPATGLLGLNDTVARSSPVQIGGMINWSTPHTTDSGTSFFIKTDGTMWGWGINTSGQVGDGTILNRSSPVQVGTLTTWSAVAGTLYNTFAVKTDSTLWGWGGNTAGNAIGMLGMVDTISRSSPAQIGTLATWARVTAGWTNVIALKTDGTLWSWGSNTNGQTGLGEASALRRSSPTQVGTLTTWSRVEAGSGTSNNVLALKTDGSIWSWGQNHYGQLGLGDRGVGGATARSSPVQVGTLTTWSRISVGPYHSVALTSGNTLWIWGAGLVGIPGLGDTIGRSSPVQLGGGAGWTSIAAGQTHTLALQDPSLLASGALFAWGQNAKGALGFGDTIYRSSPSQVGAQTMWSDVYARQAITIALKSDGTLWTWGNNSGSGALGQGDILERSSPVQVGGILPAAQTWTSVAASSPNLSATATRADGTLWVWGLNTKGQLGLTDIIDRSSPTQVGALGTWAPGPGAAGAFKQAIKTDGTMWTWGYNKFGGLGLADIVDRSSPTQVGTLTTWAKAVTASYHALTLATDGTLWGIGYNAQGHLGIGDALNRSSPVQIGTLTWRTIAAGSSNSAGIRNDSTLWSWGRNQYGQLGLGDRGAGTATSRSSPVQVGTLATWAAITVYSSHAAALRSDGTLWTWGNNNSGGLGQQDVVVRSSPTQVGTLATWTRINGVFRNANILWTGAASAPSAPRNVVAVAGAGSGTVIVSFTVPASSGSKPITQYTVTSSPGNIIATGSNNVILVTGLTNGTLYTFTVTATNSVGTGTASLKSNVAKPGMGQLFAWGRTNSNGPLGLADTINRSSPTQVGTLANWSSLVTTGNARFSVATKADGTLWSWGQNANYYALGLGDAVDRSSPVQVGTLAGWSTMTASYAATIAVKLDGTMWSWGKGFAGELGLGTASATNFSSPVQIGTLATWSAVVAGRQHALAIKTDGTLWTWGRGDHGENGDAAAIHRSSPVQVGTLATWSSVAAGMYVSFATRSDGSMWSWGSGYGAYLGQSDTVYRSSPTQIGTRNVWASVWGGYVSTAAIDTSGNMWTWGQNAYGLLGVGDQRNRSSPTQVGTLAVWRKMRAGNVNAATLALQTDGTLWSWGRGNYGEKGDSTSASPRSSPAQVGTLSDWKDIGGGFRHELGIR